MAIQFGSIAQSRLTLCDPWIAASQAFLPITNSQSLLRLMSIESGMPSKPYHSLLSPSPPTFNLPQHQGLFK